MTENHLRQLQSTYNPNKSLIENHLRQLQSTYNTNKSLIENHLQQLQSTYNPNKSLIENHLRQLQKQLEASSEKYKHFLIMGDFNADVFDPSMTSFCSLFKLKNIAKEPTCYKNPQNPGGIDSVLTNCPKSFHNTCLYETGLSDFHKLVVTILRTGFEPLLPKTQKLQKL